MGKYVDEEDSNESLEREKLLKERQKIYESEIELYRLLDGMSTEMLREIIEKAISQLASRINKKE